MQAFGKFSIEHDLEYLTEHYLYFNEDDEKLTVDDLLVLLKKKNKTIAGTIFLFNPIMAPQGYNTERPLAEQGYDFNGKYTELQFNKLMDIFQSRIKGYEGKLIEVKYLFNYNRPDIDSTTIQETFNDDIEKLSSYQNTSFNRELNYHDVKNIRISGKFVFFAWGHKFEQEQHHNIVKYAKGIFEQSRKIGKTAAFIYNRRMGIEGSEERVRFFHPIASGKLKTKITAAITKALNTNPPQPTAYEM